MARIPIYWYMSDWTCGNYSNSKFDSSQYSICTGRVCTYSRPDPFWCYRNNKSVTYATSRSIKY